MAAKSIAFQKTAAFDEFILVLKTFMMKHKVTHVSGLCDVELLRKKLSESELKELAERALKHYLFVRQKEEIHIHREMMMFLSHMCHSKAVITLHKPSYRSHKMITLFWYRGTYGATVQDVQKNTVHMFADADLDAVYSQIREEVHAKDINWDFDLKRMKKFSEEGGQNCGFTVSHEFQLVAFPAENVTGKQIEEAMFFNVGKKEYEQLLGTPESGMLNRFSASAMDEHLKDYIRKNLTSGTETGSSVREDVEPYTRFSYEKLTEEGEFPQNFGQLLKAFGKGIVRGIRNFKFDYRLIIRLILTALMTGFAAFWNIYGLCYLNDTFWLDRHAFLGSSTAYLFAGSADSGSGLYGLSVIRWLEDTTILVQPLYFLVSILLMSTFNTVISGKLGQFFKNLFGFHGKWKLYRKNLGRPVSHYFWTSVLLAAPVGLLLFNPYTVVLLAIILLLSALKGDDSKLAVLAMIWRTSTGRRRIEAGKKKIPLFATGIVRIRMFGLALLLYSLLNVFVWQAFKFNYWSRVIFTILLMVFALFRLGIIKIEKLGGKAKVMTLIGVVAIGVALVLSASGAMIAFADDGGWSESGKTLEGLFNNSGFGVILGFSLVLAAAAFSGALFVFGATAGTAAIIAGVTGGGAMIWSSTTQTGKETAYDFVLGKYSPYGGDSWIANGLDIAIGFVPYVGNAWQTVSCSRDAVYDFSNGNYLMGTLEVAFAGLGAKGFADEISTAINKVPSNIAKNDEVFSTYDERIDRTPSKNGKWTGERGESTFISDKTDKVGKYLDDAGIDGINYKNGQVDFTPVSKGNVEIPEMSVNRYGKNGNFAQADEALAKARGNGTTARDVANWRKANGYTWHECNNMKTMQKVPRAINQTFTHLGGVSECRHVDDVVKTIFDLFDE